MVVVIFRFHLKPGSDVEELGATHERMKALVGEIPGFLGVRDYSAQDGEAAVIAEFNSLESVEAWKIHPDHLAAQKQGRDRFFTDYRIQVCELIRTLKFPN